MQFVEYHEERSRVAKFVQYIKKHTITKEEFITELDDLIHAIEQIQQSCFIFEFNQTLDETIYLFNQICDDYQIIIRTAYLQLLFHYTNDDFELHHFCMLARLHRKYQGAGINEREKSYLNTIAARLGEYVLTIHPEKQKKSSAEYFLFSLLSKSLLEQSFGISIHIKILNPRLLEQVTERPRDTQLSSIERFYLAILSGLDPRVQDQIVQLWQEGAFWFDFSQIQHYGFKFTDIKPFGGSDLHRQAMVNEMEIRRFAHGGYPARYYEDGYHAAEMVTEVITLRPQEIWRLSFELAKRQVAFSKFEEHVDEVKTALGHIVREKGSSMARLVDTVHEMARRKLLDPGQFAALTNDDEIRQQQRYQKLFLPQFCHAFSNLCRFTIYRVEGAQSGAVAALNAQIALMNRTQQLGLGDLVGTILRCDDGWDPLAALDGQLEAVAAGRRGGVYAELLLGELALLGRFGGPDRVCAGALDRLSRAGAPLRLHERLQRLALDAVAAHRDSTDVRLAALAVVDRPESANLPELLRAGCHVVGRFLERKDLTVERYCQFVRALVRGMTCETAVTERDQVAAQNLFSRCSHEQIVIECADIMADTIASICVTQAQEAEDGARKLYYFNKLVLQFVHSRSINLIDTEAGAEYRERYAQVVGLQVEKILRLLDVADRQMLGKMQDRGKKYAQQVSAMQRIVTHISFCLGVADSTPGGRTAQMAEAQEKYAQLVANLQRLEGWKDEGAQENLHADDLLPILKQFDAGDAGLTACQLRLISGNIGLSLSLMLSNRLYGCMTQLLDFNFCSLTRQQVDSIKNKLSSDIKQHALDNHSQVVILRLLHQLFQACVDEDIPCVTALVLQYMKRVRHKDSSHANLLVQFISTLLSEHCQVFLKLGLTSEIDKMVKFCYRHVEELEPDTVCFLDNVLQQHIGSIQQLKYPQKLSSYLARNDVKPNCTQRNRLTTVYLQAESNANKLQGALECFISALSADFGGCSGQEAYRLCQSAMHLIRRLSNDLQATESQIHQMLRLLDLLMKNLDYSNSIQLNYLQQMLQYIKYGINQHVARDKTIYILTILKRLCDYSGFKSAYYKNNRYNTVIKDLFDYLRINDKLKFLGMCGYGKQALEWIKTTWIE